MVGLIGKKVGMSQIFLDSGHVVPVSIIKAGPCSIVQLKDEKKDGYTAIQIGIGERKHTTKALAGHLKKAQLPSIGRLFEIRVTDTSHYKVGDTLDVSVFSSGNRISITGWTKGRGFSGGVKRWGWRGGPASHGSMAHRKVGSAGPGGLPGRIWKGKTMPGRYGNERVTVKNLEVIKVDKDTHLMYVRGAVPGAKNSYVLLRKQE